MSDRSKCSKCSFPGPKRPHGLKNFLKFCGNAPGFHLAGNPIVAHEYMTAEVLARLGRTQLNPGWENIAGFSNFGESVVRAATAVPLTQFQIFSRVFRQPIPGCLYWMLVQMRCNAYFA